MEFTHCPTIVLCVGSTGADLGEALFAGTSGRSRKDSAFIWCFDNDPDAHELDDVTVRRIAPARDGGETVRGNLQNAVGDILRQILIVGQPRIAAGMERPIALRMMLVAAAWELDLTLVNHIGTAFRAAAAPYVGTSFLAELCLLLPSFGSTEHQDVPESIRGLLPVQESAFCASPPRSSALPFHICWWLDCVNAAGQALPTLPKVIQEVATVLAGLCDATPERLWLRNESIEPRLLNLGVGYAELTFDREGTLEGLAARQGRELVQRLFLETQQRVKPERVRKQVWEFTASADFAGVLGSIEFTPGGERIWKSVSGALPPEVREGQIDGFIGLLRDDLRRFFASELDQICGKFDQSSRASVERARAALEARIKAQADSLDGGLHAASIFLEEMLALLGPTTGLEGEQTENLQTLRRGYELIHAGILHIDPEVQKPYIEQLRVLFQQLGDIERMVDLTMPPAVDDEGFEALRWNVPDPDRSSWEEQLSVVKDRIEGVVREWKDASFNNEWEAQQKRHDAGRDEAKRRDEAIQIAEVALRETAVERQRALMRVEQLQRRGRVSWFGRHARRVRAANDRLARLDAQLSRSALLLVDAYRARKQLSVDEIIFHRRDWGIREIIGHARRIFNTIRATLDTLEEARNTFALWSPVGSQSLLSRPLMADGGLEILLSKFRENLHAGDFPLGLAPSEVWQLDATELYKRLRSEAERPFSAILTWSLGDLCRALCPARALVSEDAHWLRLASQPLVGPSHRTGTEEIHVCAAKGTGLHAALLDLLPGALFPEDHDDSCFAILRVCTVRELRLASHPDNSTTEP